MFYTLQEVKDSELQLQEQFWRLVKLFLFTGQMSVIFQTVIDMEILQSGLHTFAYRIRWENLCKNQTFSFSWSFYHFS